MLSNLLNPQATFSRRGLTCGAKQRTDVARRPKIEWPNARLTCRCGGVCEQLRHIRLGLQPSQLGENCCDPFPAKHVRQKMPIEYVKGGHWSSIRWEVEFEGCDLPEQSDAAAVTIASMAVATLVGISR